MVYNIINQYYTSIKDEDNHRYKSWEHCYSFFKNNHLNLSDVEKDYGMLQLAFYLASWGMYRGSSFLLHKDYKIHKYVLDVILDKKYHKLWDLKLSEEDNINDYIELLFLLKSEIIASYKDNVYFSNSSKRNINVTDTLVTKIILGTFGNVPAYDRYFKSGLKFHGIEEVSFNNSSYVKLVEFYNIFRKDFNRMKRDTKKDGIEYPIMKLIDMYFWQVGYILDNYNNDSETLKYIINIRDKYQKQLVNNQNNNKLINNVKGVFKNIKNISYDKQDNFIENKENISINKDIFSGSNFKLPNHINGRSITSKVIPTVYNLENLLVKLDEHIWNEAKLKQWEIRCFKGYNMKEIKYEIMDMNTIGRIKLIREHILSNPMHKFGAHPVDIYLVAYVSENFGIGKNTFINYCKQNGITENNNSINAIWNVGLRDGIFLGILNKDGSVKDWHFMKNWINEKEEVII